MIHIDNTRCQHAFTILKFFLEKRLTIRLRSEFFGGNHFYTTVKKLFERDVAGHAVGCVRTEVETELCSAGGKEEQRNL